MSDTPEHQITRLLEQVRLGDGPARAALVAIIYPELKKVASERMHGERVAHTLQPTALVNEVLLRLLANEQLCIENRRHFFAVSAELMRQVLVDYARRRRAVKRGGGAPALELEDWQAQIEERPELLLDVDRLLTRLSEFARRQAQVVEMRFFAGLSEQEIAASLGVSERTVKRDWQMARAWLRKELSS